MVQLIALLLAVAALVILVLQNLSPVLPLVVLGSSVGALPLSVWLLGAIAIGVVCALLIYQLGPQKRAYRPMGKRLNDPPAPEPTRFVDVPDEPVSRRGQQPPMDEGQRQNPYDSDWESFKAPEQWDDWGQQQIAGREVPGYGPTSDYQPPRRGEETVGDTVRDIESGWGDDNYDAQARRSSYRDAYGEDGGPDVGWHGNAGARDSTDDGPAGQTRTTYKEGWLYGNDANDEPPGPGEPPPEEPSDEPEDVYDANYRVIIPPYDTKND